MLLLELFLPFWLAKSHEILFELGRRKKINKTKQITDPPLLLRNKPILTLLKRSRGDKHGICTVTPK